MFRILSLATILVVAADASHYYYALGPWGLESSIINARAVREGDNDMKAVKTTSRKTGKDEGDDVEHVSAVLTDELEEAEEAFFHAVEEVEDAIIHAVDDEVETIFPHHKKSEEE